MKIQNIQKIINYALLGLFILFSQGCANSEQVYGFGLVGQKVEGDEKSVSVWNVWSAGDALPLAMKHCQKYGKTPVFKKASGITAYFDCVKQ